MGKRFPPDQPQMHTPPQSETAQIKYRDFDPDKIAEEIVNGASEIQAAVDDYENAKIVAQHVLDDEVCI